MLKRRKRRRRVYFEIELLKTDCIGADVSFWHGVDLVARRFGISIWLGKAETGQRPPRGPTRSL